MTDTSDLKHIVRRRLEFIEFQLLWEGKVGRKVLQEHFSISPQQATIDINQYLEFCPENLYYNPKQKSYIKADKFQPIFITGTASEYLAQLEMLQSGFKQKEEVWIKSLPEFESLSVSKRPIPSNILETVLKGIRETAELEVSYISVNSDDEPIRNLIPTAIVHDGHRWHMRAYNIRKEHFADYVLSRIEKIEISNYKERIIPEDESWDMTVTPILKPREDLNEKQQKHLEIEYEMVNGCFTIETRKALLWYLLRYYGFNPAKRENDNGCMVNESSFNLEIVNLVEVEHWLERRH